MALLALTISKKVFIHCEVEEATALDLDKYTIYAGGVSPADVVDKALQYVFAKDKAFADFVEKNTDVEAPPVLRVNTQKHPLKGVKRGPRATSSARVTQGGKS